MMPFKISADDFAGRMIHVLDSRRSYAVIRWQMAIVARMLRLLPNRLFDTLAAGAPRKTGRSR